MHRALVVDDLTSSREWLARAIALAFPESALSFAADLAGAFQLAEPLPSLALVDLRLPDGSGTRLIEYLAPRGTVCVVATVFDDDAHLFPALRAGAQGYVLKDQSPEALAELLRGIVAGQPPLSPSIARRLLRHFGPCAPGTDAPHLTPREIDVLRLVAKGYTLAQVAATLSLSRHTASGYLKDVYRKLSVTSRAEAALEAARLGLVAPDR
jgi:DNA-binding NarL/FixJ family response regulator